MVPESEHVLSLISVQKCPMCPNFSRNESDCVVRVLTYAFLLKVENICLQCNMSVDVIIGACIYSHLLLPNFRQSTYTAKSLLPPSKCIFLCTKTWLSIFQNFMKNEKFILKWYWQLWIRIHIVQLFESFIARSIVSRATWLFSRYVINFARNISPLGLSSY